MRLLSRLWLAIGVAILPACIHAGPARTIRAVNITDGAHFLRELQSPESWQAGVETVLNLPGWVSLKPEAATFRPGQFEISEGRLVVNGTQNRTNLDLAHLSVALLTLNGAATLRVNNVNLINV